MKHDFVSAYNARNWADIFKVKFPIKEVNCNNLPDKFEGFYHYTTLSASEKILSLNEEKSNFAVNKNNFITLHASHFLFLNDGEELLDGLRNIVDEMKKKREKLEICEPVIDSSIIKRLKYYEEQFESICPENIFTAPNHFIICFCTRGNLLTQWEWYGKECGIAIEFDLLNCEYDGIYKFAEGNPNKPHSTQPYQVVYKNEKKQQAIKRLMKIKLTSPKDVDSFAMKSIATASFMKHAGFEDEHEMRLMFSPLFHQSRETPRDSLSRIKYHEAAGIIKPYIDVNVKHKNKNALPIKSITVGPGHNQNLVFNAIMKLIQTRYAESSELTFKFKNHPSVDFCKYTTIGGIEIRCSTIPFRS